MDKELKKLVAKLERSKRKYLRKLRLSRGIRKFGKYGRIIPSGEDEDSFLWALVVNIVVHGIIGWILFLVTAGKLPIAFAIYTAVHVLIYFIGKKLEEKNLLQLEKIEDQVNDEYNSYCAKIYEAHSIVNHAYVQNSLRVTEKGWIEQKISWAGPKVDIYLKDNLSFRDGNALTDRELDEDSGEMLLNKHVAYIQFNKRFTVFVDKRDERAAVIAFSPSVQVDMVKALEKDTDFQKIQLTNGLFTSDLHWTLPEVADHIYIETDYISILDVNKKFSQYFEEVPVYADALEAKGKVVLPELAKLLSALRVESIYDTTEIK